MSSPSTRHSDTIIPIPSPASSFSLPDSQSSFSQGTPSPAEDTVNLQRLRVGNTWYYVVDPDNAEPFNEWWRITTFAVTNASRPAGSRFRPSWDQRGSRAAYWEYFRVIARTTTGVPMVYCTRCGWTGRHPAVFTVKADGTTGSRQGNSTMKSHLLTASCRAKA